MAETSIEWTDWSINPIRYGKGHYCQKISPGCANCYASNLQKRFQNPEFKGAGSKIPMVVSDPKTYLDGDSGIWFDDKKLKQVLSRKKPTKIFWCDMTDMFGEWVPNEWIDKCFATMAASPQHTHQVLTKRPQRMHDYLSFTVGHGNVLARVIEAAINLPKPKGWQAPEAFGWPYRNVWLGVSVEDKARADRLDILKDTPAAIRFASFEPLLGSIDIYGKAIDWAIIGGESGAGHRPCYVEDVRSLIRQCQENNIACFVKQLGSNPIFAGAAPHLSLIHPKGGDMLEWPDDLRVREFPRA